MQPGIFAKTYLSMWAGIETNKKIGVMYPNDADGNAIRANLAPLLEKGGYTIIDPGAYEDGTTDYSAQIQRFKDEGVEMINFSSYNYLGFSGHPEVVAAVEERMQCFFIVLVQASRDFKSYH